MLSEKLYYSIPVKHEKNIYFKSRSLVIPIEIFFNLCKIKILIFEDQVCDCKTFSPTNNFCSNRLFPNSCRNEDFFEIYFLKAKFFDLEQNFVQNEIFLFTLR